MPKKSRKNAPKVRLAEDPDDANFKCRVCKSLVHFDTPKNFPAALPPFGQCPKCKAYHALERYAAGEDLPFWGDPKTKEDF